MAILIRKAKKDDFEALAVLYRQIHDLHAEHRPDLYRPGVKTIMTRERLDAILADVDQQIYVADHDGAAVGFVQATFKDLRSRASSSIEAQAEIQAIGVDASYRGKGIGQTLMAHAESWALAKGAEYIRLGTHAFNKAAQKSYRTAGYEIESISMGKSLKQKKRGATPDV